MLTIKMKLLGMHCGHCVRAVEEVLDNAEGVHTRCVSIGSAEITAENEWPGMDDLKKNLEREGYRVEDVVSLSNESSE